MTTNEPCSGLQRAGLVLASCAFRCEGVRFRDEFGPLEDLERDGLRLGWTSGRRAGTRSGG